MNTIDRRHFLTLALRGGMGVVLAACGARPQPGTPPPTDTPQPQAAAPTDTPQPTATPQPAPVVSVEPTKQERKILRNENRPDRNVRYYRPFEAPDAARWRLSVEGLVDNPQTLTLEDVKALPGASQVSRLKCVECWSFKARWQGFAYDTLAELVKPQPQATHVHLRCADGYFEVLPIEELQQPRVLFVYGMDDDVLPDEYGAPLRIIYPAKYGYKNAKAIVTIEFKDEGGKGYWSSVGPYTVDGNITAGFDHPQDLGELKRIEGGEITEY